MTMISLLMDDPLSYFRLIAIMILSICLHELAHGIAASMQGDDTPNRSGHITMNPLIHMGSESMLCLCLFGIAWGAMPVNPRKFKSRQWGDFIVAAAGPLSNLAIGLICVGGIKLAESSQLLSREFFSLAATVNFSLFLFNCLPIPPLDGFYLFSKFFPRLKDLQHTNFGAIAMFVMLFCGVGTVLSTISGLAIDLLLGQSPFA